MSYIDISANDCLNPRIAAYAETSCISICLPETTSALATATPIQVECRITIAFEAPSAASAIAAVVRGDMDANSMHRSRLIAKGLSPTRYVSPPILL